MVLPGSFLPCLLVYLKKAGECAEIAKELKVKYKKSTLLHPKVAYLSPSIVSHEREHLSRTPLNLCVCCCRSLLAEQLHRRCWPLVQCACMQGDTRTLGQELWKDPPISGLSCIHFFFSVIYLIEFAFNRSSNSVSS